MNTRAMPFVCEGQGQFIIRLTPNVATALSSQAPDHRLTASGFFPCSIDREFLYGYAADGYRSPLWLCASYDGDPVLVHRQRGTTVYFHQAIHNKKIIAIPGIHYFDAHRLDALLLNSPELQLHPRTGNIPEPEGAGDAVDDPSSKEEFSSDEEEEVEVSSDAEQWCPPIPDPQDDPTQKKIGRCCRKVGNNDGSSSARIQYFLHAL